MACKGTQDRDLVPREKDVGQTRRGNRGRFSSGSEGSKSSSCSSHVPSILPLPRLPGSSKVPSDDSWEGSRISRQPYDGKGKRERRRGMTYALSLTEYTSRTRNITRRSASRFRIHQEEGSRVRERRDLPFPLRLSLLPSRTHSLRATASCIARCKKRKQKKGLLLGIQQPRRATRNRWTLLASYPPHHHLHSLFLSCCCPSCVCPLCTHTHTPHPRRSFHEWSRRGSSGVKAAEHSYTRRSTGRKGDATCRKDGERVPEALSGGFQDACLFLPTFRSCVTLGCSRRKGCLVSFHGRSTKVQVRRTNQKLLLSIRNEDGIGWF